MAGRGVRFSFSAFKRLIQSPSIYVNVLRKNHRKFFVFASTAVGVSYFLYSVNSSQISTFNAVRAAEPDSENVFEKQKISVRERRYRAFASLEYDGEIYMSPQDFLESVTQDTPRHRKRRHVLSKVEVDSFLRNTPTKWRGTHDLFRRMGDKGLISYTEYLFLLCVLTKPKSGFEIAFNMFDTDMNKRVDRSEFLVLTALLTKSQMNNIMTNKLTKKTITSEGEEYGQDKSSSLKKEPVIEEDVHQDTTLLIHFFGQKGKDRLTFEEFGKFMENLQTEALEIEFMEYSKGLQTISESEFARILLRYTKVQEDDYDFYIDKIKNRMNREEGIPFDDFKKFFQFLNNLDDFTMAMRMYTLADRPISQQEFQRAVKACVDYQLNPRLVETVFVVFDQDGDGHLSYHEFVCIMKDRLARGLSTTRNSAPNRWEAYRHCVRDVMREKS